MQLLDSSARDLEVQSDSAEQGSRGSVWYLAAVLDHPAAESVAVSAAAFAPLRQSFPRRPCLREPQF